MDITTARREVTVRTMSGQETVGLCYGWSFSDETNGTSILAHLFGQMVKRATPVVHSYQGDLFHDAEWLRKYVTGECEFFWMVRECGTNLGESAIVQEEISSTEPRVLYHVALRDANGRNKWEVTFTEVVVVERTSEEQA